MRIVHLIVLYVLLCCFVRLVVFVCLDIVLYTCVCVCVHVFCVLRCCFVFSDSDFHSTDPEERQRRAVFNTSVVEERGVVKINASCKYHFGLPAPTPPFPVLGSTSLIVLMVSVDVKKL